MKRSRSAGKLSGTATLLRGGGLSVAQSAINNAGHFVPHGQLDGVPVM